MIGFLVIGSTLVFVMLFAYFLGKATDQYHENMFGGIYCYEKEKDEEK